MKFLSLEPFVPSGADFERSKQLFIDLGFHVNWETGGYAGLQKDGCKFILQTFNNRDFADNFMVSVKVESASGFLQMLREENIGTRYGVRFTEVLEQPYGREVNLIDLAGVCWHFVED